MLNQVNIEDRWDVNSRLSNLVEFVMMYKVAQILIEYKSFVYRVFLTQKTKNA